MSDIAAHDDVNDTAFAPRSGGHPFVQEQQEAWQNFRQNFANRRVKLRKGWQETPKMWRVAGSVALATIVTIAVIGVLIYAFGPANSSVATPATLSASMPKDETRPAAVSEDSDLVVNSVLELKQAVSEDRSEIGAHSKELMVVKRSLSDVKEAIKTNPALKSSAADMEKIRKALATPLPKLIRLQDLSDN